MKPRGLAELDDLELVFNALSHAQRRQILVVLDARGGAMTSGEIAERFSCKWPTTSRHLRVLEEAGLVEVEQRGREWNYTLNRTKLGRVAGGWINAFRER